MCSSVNQTGHAFAKHNPQSLYCLEDYSTYAVQGQENDDTFRELRIWFEVCVGDDCADDIEDYLLSRTFKIYIEELILNPDALGTGESSFTADIINWVYPFLPNYKM